MHRSVVNNIISGRKSRGENNYMLEEIYISDVCTDNIVTHNDPVTEINPYQAWYDHGKYRFQYPHFWYTSVSNNKAIGLRKIEVRPPAYNGVVRVEFTRNTPPSTTVYFYTVSALIHITPDMDIEQSLSTICAQINYAMRKRYQKNDGANATNLTYEYDADTYEAKLTAVTEHIDADGGTAADPNIPHVAMTLYLDPDLMKMLNRTEPMPDDNDRYESITFYNVWNRRFLFVHASFVSGTSFQYLGRSGDFYPKPSKMYRFNGDSQDFYFELSFDGRTPVEVPDVHFIIELCYIYHDNHYQAE